MPGEICPTAKAPVLVREGSGDAPALMKWGYQLPGTLVINARAETVQEKPLFRRSLAARRCLILQQPSMNGRRQAEISVHSPEEPVFYMAGFFDRRDGEDCYCVLTTAANDSMKPVHDRMPLILPHSQAEQWLSDGSNAEVLLAVTPPALAVRSEEQQLSLWWMFALVNQFCRYKGHTIMM